MATFLLIVTHGSWKIGNLSSVYEIIIIIMMAAIRRSGVVAVPRRANQRTRIVIVV